MRCKIHITDLRCKTQFITDLRCSNGHSTLCPYELCFAVRTSKATERHKPLPLCEPIKGHWDIVIVAQRTHLNRVKNDRGGKESGKSVQRENLEERGRCHFLLDFMLSPFPQGCPFASQQHEPRETRLQRTQLIKSKTAPHYKRTPPQSHRKQIKAAIPARETPHSLCAYRQKLPLICTKILNTC